MAKIVRPQFGPQESRAQLGLSEQAGQGLMSLGSALTNLGSSAKDTHALELANEFGGIVSNLSRQVFAQSRRATTTGVVSNALSDATLSFQKEQQLRLEKVTDDKGNPTYTSLVDDVGSIGTKIANSVAGNIEDEEARKSFLSKFKSFVTNQQILALNKARKQQIDFGLASLDKGLGALASQGANDSYYNVNSYVNQGVDLLDNALQSGLISAHDHDLKKEEFISVVREASLANTIRRDRNEATKLLRETPEELGITEDQHEKLVSANIAAVVSDDIQAVKGVQLAEAESESKKAGLAQELSTRIEANALREDELLLNENNLDPVSFQRLKQDLKKSTAKFQKQTEELQEVSRIIAKGGDLSQVSSTKVDNHYRFQVQSLMVDSDTPITYQDKANIAAQYPGPVNAFSREMNGALHHGDLAEAAQAAIAYTYIRDKNVRALDTGVFTKKAAQIAENATLLNQVGIPIEQAVQISRDRIDNLDQNLREENEKRFKSLQDFKIENLENTLSKAVGEHTFFSSFRPKMDAEAKNTFKQLAKDLFVLDGDADKAKKGAANMMRLRYGDTEVNGGKMFMNSPPEKVYQLPTEEIRQQLEEDVKTLVPKNVDLKKVFIHSDALTRGFFKQGKDGPYEDITYLVTYIHPIFGEEVSLLDENGNVKRWKPDVNKFVAKFTKEQISKAKQKRQEKETLTDISSKIDIANIPVIG